MLAKPRPLEKSVLTEADEERLDRSFLATPKGLDSTAGGKRSAAPGYRLRRRSTAKRLHKRGTSPRYDTSKIGRHFKAQGPVEPLRGSWRTRGRDPGCAARPWAMEWNRFAVLHTTRTRIAAHRTKIRAQKRKETGMNRFSSQGHIFKRPATPP